jgi:hypothetical protein
MNQFPEMKGFYIVMDNTPIYTANEIEEIISERIQKHLSSSIFT